MDMARRWIPGRGFVAGCLVGLLLGSAGLVAAALGGALLFKDRLVARKAAELGAPPVPLGRAADYDWRVEWAGGAPLDFADLRGKVVFLHFWAPNCIHCLPELASINRLYKVTDPNEVAFVCVAVAGSEGLAGFMRAEALDFPAWYADEPVPEAYDFRGPPATFVLSRDGRIVFAHRGPARWDGQDVQAFLRRLAAEPAPAAAGR